MIGRSFRGNSRNPADRNNTSSARLSCRKRISLEAETRYLALTATKDFPPYLELMARRVVQGTFSQRHRGFHEHQNVQENVACRASDDRFPAERGPVDFPLPHDERSPLPHDEHSAPQEDFSLRGDGPPAASLSSDLKDTASSVSRAVKEQVNQFNIRNRSRTGQDGRGTRKSAGWRRCEPLPAPSAQPPVNSRSSRRLPRDTHATPRSGSRDCRPISAAGR